LIFPITLKMKLILQISFLTLATVCWAWKIPNAIVDDILLETDRHIRGLMRRHELPPHMNSTHFYKKRLSPEVKEIGLRSIIFAEAADRIAREHDIALEEAERILDKRAAPRPGFNANLICSRTIGACNTQTRYRTSDGSCNNLVRPDNGMAIIRMDRMLPAVYNDGVQTFRKSVTGDDLLSPRIISLILHPDRNILHNIVTTMVVGFGQFLDHDITSTPENTNLQCCTNRNNPECMPITVPTNDDFYAQFQIGCLDIGRSIRACGTGRREQINQVSAFIDGSQIYGSSVQEQNNLRSFSNGMLLTDTQNNRLLPKDQNAVNCGVPQNGILCFRAGDDRLNENPGLTSMHTIWLREHNRIAAGLRTLNPSWNDETLYQETRRIVIGELQNIVYSEYLPVVLGSNTMANFALNLPAGSGTSTYNSNTVPNIFNSFATAGYRFGHTLIPNAYNMPGNGQFLLENNFQNPQVIYQSPANIDRIMQGFVTQPAMDYDNWMSQAVTNHLFQQPNAPFGTDLAALNIQRGRDHGLPPYNDFRASCGLNRIASFQDLLPIVGDQDIVTRITNSYRNVNDIDLWPAGISELPLPGAVVGPTFACILGRQFNRLIYGDRFFFTHASQAGSFTVNQRANLRQRTLGSVICDNANPTVTSAQQNVFIRQQTPVACVNQPKLNLNNWKA